MANLNMDLTGTLPDYRVEQRIFRVFRYDQYLDFESTVYSESIRVFLISGPITTELVLGEDYSVPEEAIRSCDNDMSSAKLMDPDFNKELTRGITMMRPLTGSNYTISINYQQLYPNQVRTAYLHNQPIEFTPELLVSMVHDIEELKILTSRVTNVFDINKGDTLLLEADESKTNPNNYIEDEAHTVDVTGNRFLIHPKGGSFYYDSITVKHPATNSTLVLNKDYRIVGIDEAKTKSTSHTAPVYQFIQLLIPIVGEVKISYWAFGGDPTLDNYRDILTKLHNVTNYLNDSNTLTAQTLPSTEVMVSIFDRLSEVEKTMRRLTGTPAYGDITSGKAILMKLFSESAGLHWYTIASLYQVVGTEIRPCTADTFIFRLQSQLSHFQWKAEVSVDLTNTEGNRLTMNITSENYPRGYIPFTDYENVERIIRPQMRLVWVEGDRASGAYLQLGFELKGMVEETIAIEDLSGHESCWKLIEEKSEVTTPQDDNFTMPDESSVWSSLLESAKSETTLVPFKNGHIIWAGVHKLNRPTAGWDVFEVDNLFLDKTTDIRRFTKLRIDLEEHLGFQFPVDIPFNSGTSFLKGHTSFTYQNRPAYINAEMWKDEDDNIKLRLNYDIGIGIDANELNIRDMVIYL